MNTNNILGKGMRNIVIGFVTVLILSCTVSKSFFLETTPEFPEDPSIDRSLITGQPCQAPCWYGLKLGKSTIDEVRSTLQNLAFVDSSQILEQPINNLYPDQKLFIFSCVYANHSYDCGSLETSEDGKLAKIYLAIMYPLDIRFLVEKLGSPQYFSVFGPAPNLGGCLIYIYWPSKNIYAQINDDPGKELCVNAKNADIDLDLQVDAIRYEVLNIQEIKDGSFPWSNIKP